MDKGQNEACYRKFQSIFHFKFPLFDISSIMNWTVIQVYGVWHCARHMRMRTGSILCISSQQWKFEIKTKVRSLND